MYRRNRFVALLLSLLPVLVFGCGGGRGDASKREGSQAPQGLAVRWHRDGIGMSDAFLSSGGRLLAADSERVYAASGFGDAGAGAPRHTVTALDRVTGETRWTINRSGPPFLQGVAGDVLLVNEQYDVVAGIDTSTGMERWSLDLSGRGLGGYGASVSVVSDGAAVMGLSAQSEGDVRPPVIVAIDPTSGQLRWRSTLTSGTDLNFGAPAVVDGSVVFLSTPSHPGSPPGMAHAVNLSDGAVRWAVELGGQGFHAIGAVASRGGVHIPGPGVVYTVDRVSGALRWRRDAAPLAALAVLDDRLLLLTDRGMAAVDPVTGEEQSSRADTRQFLGGHLLISLPGKPVVLAVDRLQGRGVDTHSLATSWSQDWPGALVDIPLLSSELLIVTSGDRRVTAYDLPMPPASKGIARSPKT
jgi:outer membrane protein assembly factor BamB